ncbi:MAG: hypothetical protein OXE86_06555 [Alphaproteobacteria bacterium]|nr:hypothetical protein [Alphaproteobacteria bacterium]
MNPIRIAVSIVALGLLASVFGVRAHAHTVLPVHAADTVQGCMDTLNRVEMKFDAVVQTLPRSELEALTVWAMAKFRGLMAAFRNNALKPDLFDDEETGLMVWLHARDCLCILAEQCER